MELVKEFMIIGGQKVSETPDLKVFENESLIKLRNDLINEEILETINAYKNNDIKEQKDGIADIAYVTYGYLITIGCQNLDVDHIKTYNDINDDLTISLILKKLSYIYDDMKDINNKQKLDNEYSKLYYLSYQLNYIINLLEKYANILGYKLIDLINVVHTSNMTKFPKTIVEAEFTINKYVDHPLYKGVHYEKVNDYYVVKSDAGKILKSIYYKDPIWT
jgi:hypothetical protein